MRPVLAYSPLTTSTAPEGEPLLSFPQDYSGPEIVPSSLGRPVSTNPFRSSSAIDYSLYGRHYPNPFAAYPCLGRPHPYEEGLLQGSRRTYPPRSEPLYSPPKPFEDYRLPLHSQSLEEDLGSAPKYHYEIGPSASSSQLAYARSLAQALTKKRALQAQQASLQHRYDKIKQDKERIREEERILNQLRYENELLRRERFESALKTSPPFSLTALYDLSESARDAISDNLAYDYQRGASDLREELEKTMLYDLKAFSSLDSRDSPPPPAPDVGSGVSRNRIWRPGGLWLPEG